MSALALSWRNQERFRKGRRNNLARPASARPGSGPGGGGLAEDRQPVADDAGRGGVGLGILNRPDLAGQKRAQRRLVRRPGGSDSLGQRRVQPPVVRRACMTGEQG